VGAIIWKINPDETPYWLLITKLYYDESQEVIVAFKTEDFGFHIDGCFVEEE